jgi:PAS domain S-box-containing protein
VANTATARLMGAQSVKDLLGKTDADFYSPAIAAQCQADERRILETGQPLLNREERMITPAGEEIWLLTSKVALRDGDGRPYGIVGVGRNITTRKQIEAQLLEAETQYRTLVEQLPAITYRAEFGDGPWSYVSPQIESLLGFTPAEWMAQNSPWWNQLHAEDRPAVLAAEQRARETGEALAMEYRMSAKDGRIHWFSDHAVVVRDATGEPRYLHGVMYDITSRKALEEQLAQAHKMDAVGRLAGGVAHDFNNILTAVLGYIDLLMRHAADPAHVTGYASEIRKAAERAAALTRQLLAFSRKQALRPQVLDLRAVVAEMDPMLRRLLGEMIQLDVSAGGPLWRVKADPGQIQQVIMNLCINARDAMPAGGTLTIETANVVLDEHYVRDHAEARVGEHVLLAITDTGQGMTAEVREHLFEPFFTTKEQGRGTGLGLATCYGIVKQTGGHIHVYSEPQRGTTFKVYLPRVHDAAEVAVASEPPRERPGGTERVLLVEDEEPVRELAACVLRDLGYTVLTARNGHEALRLAKSDPDHRVDLLFTDVVMPAMGGKELAYWYRLTHPDTRVLFTSGYPDKSIVHNGELMPGLAFLQKPYTPAALAGKIREVLDH